MADAMRDAFVVKILQAKQDAAVCGPIHRRDLLKGIRRMEQELRDYDRFHEGGGSNGKRAEPRPKRG